MLVVLAITAVRSIAASPHSIQGTTPPPPLSLPSFLPSSILLFFLPHFLPCLPPLFGSFLLRTRNRARTPPPSRPFTPVLPGGTGLRVRKQLLPLVPSVELPLSSGCFLPVRLHHVPGASRSLGFPLSFVLGVTAASMPPNTQCCER